MLIIGDSSVGTLTIAAGGEVINKGNGVSNIGRGIFGQGTVTVTSPAQSGTTPEV